MRNITKLYMVPIFPCYPSGTILLRTKVTFLKRMHRLISISVNYMLGNRYISYKIIQGTSSAFPCGRTQHVRCRRSSIVSMIQSVFEFRFMHSIPHSRLNGRLNGRERCHIILKKQLIFFFFKIQKEAKIALTAQF